MPGTADRAGGLAPSLLDKAGSLLGLKRKQGVLLTAGRLAYRDASGRGAGRPEPSLAVELFETKGKRWLTSGWSLDAIATPARAGLGVAKDLYSRGSLEVDLGGYVTQEFGTLAPACAAAGAAGRRGEFRPALGVGLNVRF